MRSAVLLFCLIIADVAFADSVEIALPDLTGDYDSEFLPPNEAPRVRISIFTIPAEVVSIQDLHVVVSGSSGDGWMICEIDIGGGQTIQDTLSVVTQMRLVLTAPTLEGGCLSGVVNLLTPTFSDESGWVTSCEIADPLDPDRLLNTTIQAALECNFSPACPPWIDALATLTEVGLVLDAQLVGAGSKTWGKIKAIYR